MFDPFRNMKPLSRIPVHCLNEDSKTNHSCYITHYTSYRPTCYVYVNNEHDKNSFNNRGKKTL
jgi:hypothetical protein